MKKYRYRIVIFNIFCFIFNIFGWYYAACFCAVYKKAQKHIFYDFIYEILANIIICVIISLLRLIVQFIKLKVQCSKMKIMDNKIIKFVIFIIIFFIQMVIEYYIIKLVKKLFE